MSGAGRKYEIVNFKKRIGVLVLAVSVMFVGLVSPVYAAYDNYSDEGIEEYTVDEANDNTVIVESEDGVERLTVTEDDNTRKVTIYNVTTGEEYLILNKVDGSIYSSITNKTVNIDEQAPSITPRSVTSYSTVYISWAEKYYRYNCNSWRCNRIDFDKSSWSTSCRRYNWNGKHYSWRRNFGYSE